MRRATVLGAGKGAHAIVDAAVCPACSHPLRLHNGYGCVRAECECALDRDGHAQPPAGVEPVTAAQVDALDPPCARCAHRRGRHAVLGTGLPCRDCSCPSFATEALNAVAAPAGPAPAVVAAPAGPAADVEAAPDGAAGAAGATARAGFGLKTPRRQNPRPAAERALVPAAVVGGDDADGETVAAAAAVAPVDLTELAAAVPRAVAALEVPAVGGALPAGMGAAGMPPAAPALTEDLIYAAALMVYRGWWCARCSSRRLDPGACPDCKRALQPVHVAILPRELTA